MNDNEVVIGRQYWYYNKADSAHGQKVSVTGLNDNGVSDYPWEVRFENDGETFGGTVKASELRDYPVDSHSVAKIRTAITMLKTMNDGKYPAWVFSQVGKDASMIIKVLEDGLRE